MNTAHKLQRLHALRLHRSQIDAEIALLEDKVDRDAMAHNRARTGYRQRPRNTVHIEAPAVHHEQDLSRWGKRLKDVEGLG